MFRDLFDTSRIIELLIRIPCILIALTVHEAAHGYVAAKMGDKTAAMTGRVSLNPLRHLDPIGTLCMLFFGVGWAKPVPIMAYNFKNRKKGMALTALAGPVSNLLLGFIGVFLYYLFFALAPSGMNENFAYAIILLLASFTTLNISFAVFNMIPIPPLDGSRVLFVFLPSKYYFGIMKYERYIMIGFMLLLWTDILTVPISGAVSAIINAMSYVVCLIPGL